MVFGSLRFLGSAKTSAVQDERPQNSLLANKSALKDFLASIATMGGDLSNITAPPFVLDPKSVVEIPAYWSENPAQFISPALSEKPEERALAILRSFLAGMKSQCYMGHTEEEGVKKPLNAFLGELFIAHWDDKECGTTYCVSEQVLHHPPVTACRVWNPKYGVIAEGYNRQKITFSMGSVHILSSGFALKSVERYNEHYLQPLPDFKVKGVLSGAPYPETQGDWYIPSTSGYMSKVTFTGGKGMFGGGTKHQFSASVYHEEEGEQQPIYTLHGCWNTKFTVRDERTGEDIETFDVVEENKGLPPLQLPPLEEMDPWETRRAWHDACEAILQNDFRKTSAAKGFLEQGQRNMRKEEEANGKKWQQRFFNRGSSHDIVEQLMAKVPGQDYAKVKESAKGGWSFDMNAWEAAEKPFHPGLEPDNVKEGEERVYRDGARGSFQASRSGTPRGSIDMGRRVSIDSAQFRDSTEIARLQRPRQSIDSSRASIDSSRFKESTDVSRSQTPRNGVNGVDRKVGVVEDERPAHVDGVQVDIGNEPDKPQIEGITKKQPDPQQSQIRSEEEDLGSGVEGLSVKEKVVTEDMLRELYSSKR